MGIEDRMHCGRRRRKASGAFVRRATATTARCGRMVRMEHRCGRKIVAVRETWRNADGSERWSSASSRRSSGCGPNRIAAKVRGVRLSRVTPEERSYGKKTAAALAALMIATRAK